MWKLQVITVLGLSLTTLELFSFSVPTEERIITILGLTIASFSLWLLMEKLADEAEYRERKAHEPRVTLMRHSPRH